MQQNPKVKTVNSTSTVTFRNTSGSFYDMIISVQNQTIDQSISITDTQGNLITENPIVLTVPAKVILKDVQVGTITFSDVNSYSIIISYLVKESANGIPYVDVDYQNGYIYTQETGAPVTETQTGDLIGFSPPANKKWILRSIMITWTAAATQTDNIEVSIIPTGLSGPGLDLLYTALSVTAGDNYSVDLAKYVQTMSSTEITYSGGSTYVTLQTVPGGFELYSNEILTTYVQNETATITVTVSYIEVNLG